MIYEFKRWRVEVDYYHDEDEGLQIQIGSSQDVPTVGGYGGQAYNTRIGFKVPVGTLTLMQIKERCVLLDARTRHIPTDSPYLPSFMYELGKELSRA